MLGAIGLSSADGSENDAILRQPKSLALLAYLALPRPGAWHRRDVLLATFWPELAQSAARAALRSALSLLRRHLAEGTIRTRGDDEVALDATLFSTDVAAFLDDVDAGDPASAVTRYAGELLPGLYVTDAPEFERWLELERARLKSLAFRAATALAEERERAGALESATVAAARACGLAPDDEAAARRWIALLDRTGDRSQALAVYERFRSRVVAEFGAEPSRETVALVDEIRLRPAAVRGTGRSEQGRPAPAVAPDAPQAAMHPAPPVELPATRSRAVSPRTVAVALVLGASIVSVALVVAYGRMRGAAAPSAEQPVGAARRLVLLPVQSDVGDSTGAYVASGVGYGITRRLERLGNLSVRVASRAESSPTPRRELEPGAPLGSTVLLAVTVDSIRDSLDVRASLIDSATQREREVLARRLPLAQLPDVESQVAVAVTGALHRVGVPFGVRAGDRPVDPEAYRLTLLGYHQLVALADDETALTSFVRATQLDPLYARAWAGLASLWGLRTGASQVAFDEGYDRTAAAASRALALDSTQGSALASLGLVTALKHRRLDAGQPLIRRAMAYEPSNPEVFVIASFLQRYAHRWDEARDLVRVARQLDPLTLRYPSNEAGVELCAGRPEAAERVYRDALERNPAYREAREGLVHALALQGRYDDALAVWRADVDLAKSPALAAAVAWARGREGYLAAVHTDGGIRLREFRRDVAGRPGSTLRLLHEQFRAGDTAAGFASLEAGIRERARWIYRLPCFATMDEVRGTPRYAALLARIGPMPAH